MAPDIDYRKLSSGEITARTTNHDNIDRPQSFNGSASEQMSNLPPSESKRHSICNGGDQRKLTSLHEKQDQLLKCPLQKELYEKFHQELVELRHSTKEALQLSCKEQERLSFQAQTMANRIAYLRKKIHEACDVLEGGVENEDIDNELRISLRMSMVKEGSQSSIEVDESEDDVAKLSESTMKRIVQTQQGLNASLSSNTHRSSQKSSFNTASGRRSSMRSSLYDSQLSKGTNSTNVSNISEATNVPHMSRSSLLGMLKTSTAWLDQHDDSKHSNSSTETEEKPRNSFRFSFMDDGMPSRWRAREKAQARKSKQEEEEEKRKQEQALQDKRESNEVKLEKIISQREEEISALEKRTMSVVNETSSLRDTISILEDDKKRSHDEYEKERTKLLNELSQVDADNERLDYMLIETSVGLDEQKMSVELLASELKEARITLAKIQNERDQQKRKQKWKRNRRLAALQQSVDVEEGDKEEEISPKDTSQSQVKKDQQGKLTRYDPCLDGQDDPLDLDRSNRSDLSGLTMDSGDMIDVLEQIELGES